MRHAAVRIRAVTASAVACVPAIAAEGTRQQPRTCQSAQESGRRALSLTLIGMARKVKKSQAWRAE